MNENQSNKLLASYALFKGLYDTGKDIYGVIAEYLKKTISEKGLYNFTLDEITRLLNKEFEFNIPNAVVKSSLNRIKNITKKGANYEVNNPNDFIVTDFNEFEKDYQKRNDSIIENLINYVEDVKQKKINEDEKTSLTHSFCNYILDKQNGNENLEYISAFILKHNSDQSFKSQIDKIREGVILYSGIKFNNDINDFSAWKTELTIYMETEILFHLAGYNGELYKILATDLLQYIRELNQKAGKKMIKLKYFNDVKDEIEGFFTKAKYLLDGNAKPNPSTTAMASIINGCKAQSDILAKRTDFYELLRRNSIEKDDYTEYYSERNYRYNIVNQNLIDNISEEIRDDANDYLKFLNFISIHRREANENNFENIKAILLSGNSTTLKVAWNDLVKEEGYVPLATTMSFLTNKFWFKLNKGFGKDKLPKSFDIISKSQIILSTILNKKIGNDYEELQEEFRKGTLNEEQVKARLVDLRSSVRKPEEIEKDTIDDVLQVITEDSLSKFIEEQAHFKSKATQQILENEELKSRLADKEQTETDLKESKKEIIQQKEFHLMTLRNSKQPIDNKALKSYKAHKLMLKFLFALLFAIAGAFIWYANWEKLEKYTYVFGLVPFLICVIYFISKEKEIKPINALKKHLSKYKEKTYQTKYKEFNFDIETYLRLEEELNETKKK
jgi:hypothetical protein